MASRRSRQARAVAAVSQPQWRPMTSWMTSWREEVDCSLTTFSKKTAPCSAAVQAPSVWRIGITSLSMVLGRPTTVRS